MVMHAVKIQIYFDLIQVQLIGNCIYRMMPGLDREIGAGQTFRVKISATNSTNYHEHR